MRELAAFVSSDEGRLYARTCQTWGTDPAAFLEPVDDVLAYNLRVGLMFRLDAKAPPEEIDPEAQAFRSMNRRSREQSRQLAAMLHG